MIQKKIIKSTVKKAINSVKKGTKAVGSSHTDVDESKLKKTVTGKIITFSILIFAIIITNGLIKNPKEKMRQLESNVEDIFIKHDITYNKSSANSDDVRKRLEDKIAIFEKKRREIYENRQNSIVSININIDKINQQIEESETNILNVTQSIYHYENLIDMSDYELTNYIYSNYITPIEYELKELDAKIDEQREEEGVVSRLGDTVKHEGKGVQEFFFGKEDKIQNERDGIIESDTESTIIGKKDRKKELKEDKKYWVYCYKKPKRAKEKRLPSDLKDYKQELNGYNRSKADCIERKKIEEVKIADLEKSNQELEESQTKMIKINEQLTLVLDHSLKDVLRKYN